jgi:hypothetical protein
MGSGAIVAVPEHPTFTVGHPLLDDHLAFVGVRARGNTWLSLRRI